MFSLSLFIAQHHRATSPTHIHKTHQSLRTRSLCFSSIIANVFSFFQSPILSSRPPTHTHQDAPPPHTPPQNALIVQNLFSLSFTIVENVFSFFLVLHSASSVCPPPSYTHQDANPPTHINKTHYSYRICCVYVYKSTKRRTNTNAHTHT